MDLKGKKLALCSKHIIKTLRNFNLAQKSENIHVKLSHGECSDASSCWTTLGPPRGPLQRATKALAILEQLPIRCGLGRLIADEVRGPVIGIVESARIEQYPALVNGPSGLHEFQFLPRTSKLKQRQASEQHQLESAPHDAAQCHHPEQVVSADQAS